VVHDPVALRRVDGEDGVHRAIHFRRFNHPGSTGEPMKGTGVCGLVGASGQTCVATITSPAGRPRRFACRQASGRLPGPRRAVPSETRPIIVGRARGRQASDDPQRAGLPPADCHASRDHHLDEIGRAARTFDRRHAHPIEPRRFKRSATNFPLASADRAVPPSLPLVATPYAHLTLLGQRGSENGKRTTDNGHERHHRDGCAFLIVGFHLRAFASTSSIGRYGRSKPKCVGPASASPCGARHIGSAGTRTPSSPAPREGSSS